jgi:hypothetical protein
MLRPALLAAGALAAAAGAGAGAVGASQGPTATAARPANMVMTVAQMKGTRTGFDFQGIRISGRPLGTGTGTGGLTISRTTGRLDVTWRVKGGTVRITSNAQPRGANVSGTWKVVGGTGKFRRVRGGGRMNGQVAKMPARVRFTGTITY